MRTCHNVPQVRVLLPGQYYDQETNLHYNYFRDYDSTTGRYIESDPIGLIGGLNTYGYVIQNPLSYFDSKGLEVRFICRTVASDANVTGAQHCFVYVTCPSEKWERVFSLFGVPETSSFGTAGAFPRAGYKHSYDPRKPSNADDRRDVPSANNSFNEPVQCNNSQECQCEKEILDAYKAFPDVFVNYNINGPNSNSFAADLIRKAPSCLGLPEGAPADTIYGGAPGISQGNPGIPYKP